MRVSSVSLSTVLAVVLAGPVFAADVAKRPPPVAEPIAVPLSLWSGFYVGANAGVGGGKVDYPVGIAAGPLAVAGSAGMNAAGMIAGVQAGYNWVFPNRILAGIEADFGWSNLEDKLSAGGTLTSGGVPIGSAGAAVGSRLDYLGTVRGRLGYIVTDPWLVYLTGGWAWGSVNSFYSAGIVGGPSVAGDVSKNMSGWAAGIGTEYAITPDISFRAEYLHVDLGSANLAALAVGPVAASVRVAPAYDFVRAGVNYRFGGTGSSTAMQPSAFTAPRNFDWTGLHIGVNGGYGMGTHDYPITATLGAVGISGKAAGDASGFLGGAQIGYDLQLSNHIVVGLEADFDWADIKGPLSAGGSASIGGVPLGSATASVGTALDYIGTVRGRIGYAVGDPWLVYATGGWAYGGTTSSAGIDIPGVFTGGLSRKRDHSGWVAGLGTEFAVTPNLTLRAEYMHVDFSSETLLALTLGGAAARIKVDPSYDIVRVGMNYKFDFGGSSPVFAKY